MRIDLDRIRQSEMRIEELLRAHPELKGRTACFLASEPSQEKMEGLKRLALERPLQLRLPEDILRRIDALTEILQKDPTYKAVGRISRSTALRLALIRGLEVLEQEQKSPTPKAQEEKDGNEV